MVLSLQIYICVHMFTHICSTAAIWFTTKNLEEYTLFLADTEKYDFFETNVEEFSQKIVFWIIF